MWEGPRSGLTPCKHGSLLVRRARRQSVRDCEELTFAGKTQSHPQFLHTAEDVFVACRYTINIVAQVSFKGKHEVFENIQLNHNRPIQIYRCLPALTLGVPG